MPLAGDAEGREQEARAQLLGVDLENVADRLEGERLGAIVAGQPRELLVPAPFRTIGDTGSMTQQGADAVAQDRYHEPRGLVLHANSLPSKERAGTGLGQGRWGSAPRNVLIDDIAATTVWLLASVSMNAARETYGFRRHDSCTGNISARRSASVCSQQKKT